MNKFQEKLYQKIITKRDKIMRPFTISLSLLKVSPNIVTASGIIFMILFAYFLETNPLWAANFLIISLILDSLDGALARYQGQANDRGKFIDISADVLNYFIFLGGLTIAQIIEPLSLLLLAFFMLASKTLRVFINSKKYNSNWLFRPVAGFLPNLISYLSYIIIVLPIYFKYGIIQNQIFFIFALILIIDTIINFFQIIRRNDIQY